MSTPTDSQKNFEAITIGQDMGTFEMTLDEETVRDRMDLVRWQAGGLVEKGLAAPGLTISHHARMKFDALPAMRVSIWAKSEQEFLKPMKVGSRIFISGKIVDKYTRRGRNYIVTELETTDESGEVILRSRETGVYVE